MPALDEIPGYSMNNKGQKRIIKIVESKLVVEEIPERESEKPNIKAEEKVEEKVEEKEEEKVEEEEERPKSFMEIMKGNFNFGALPKTDN